MTGNIEIVLYERFLPALAELPKSIQHRTNAFVKKFVANPTSTGINFERIANAANPLYRSVRINRAYRAILLMPEVGNEYVMLWVDRHDDAYDWAVRTRVQVNPRTNVLQVYRVLRTEVVEGDDRVGDDDPAVVIDRGRGCWRANSGTWSPSRRDPCSISTSPGSRASACPTRTSRWWWA